MKTAVASLALVTAVFAFLELTRPAWPGYSLTVEVVRIVDGDTLVVNLPCQVSIVCTAMPVRLRGLDTPELRGKCPKERQAALRAQEILKLLVLGARTVRLEQLGRDKFFRIDATVVADGIDEGAILDKKGVARPYTGQGPRGSWCGP